MKNYKYFIIHEFEELQSTNSHAMNLAKNSQIFENEIIVASQQTGGRGRINRKWESPKGNLYFSLILQPKVEFQKIPQISFIAAVALKKTLEKLLSNQKINNKWPNDILVNHKKIAGILIENYGNFVVLGVGINILSSPQSFAASNEKIPSNNRLIFPATSLAEFSVKISPQKLLEIFLDEFEIFYKNWLDFGFAGIRNAWLQGAFRFKEEIKINAENKTLIGNFEDIDLEGNLLLKIAGKIQKISCGDVS